MKEDEREKVRGSPGELGRIRKKNRVKQWRCRKWSQEGSCSDTIYGAPRSGPRKSITFSLPYPSARAEEVIAFTSRQKTLQYRYHAHLLTVCVKARFRKAVARIPTENIGKTIKNNIQISYPLHVQDHILCRDCGRLHVIIANRRKV